MLRFGMRSLSGLAVLLPALTLLLATPDGVLAQDEPKSETKRAKQRAPSRGPLPAYYSDVIDGLQREKMYEIQKKYEAEIKALEDQLAALNKKLDDELKTLLRPDQVERVEQLNAEAMKKRKMRKKTDKADAAEASAK
jgi:hypothetical protein